MTSAKHYIILLTSEMTHLTNGIHEYDLCRRVASTVWYNPFIVNKDGRSSSPLNKSKAEWYERCHLVLVTLGPALWTHQTQSPAGFCSVNNDVSPIIFKMAVRAHKAQCRSSFCKLVFLTILLVFTSNTQVRWGYNRYTQLDIHQSCKSLLLDHLFNFDQLPPDVDQITATRRTTHPDRKRLSPALPPQTKKG